MLVGSRYLFWKYNLTDKVLLYIGDTKYFYSSMPTKVSLDSFLKRIQELFQNYLTEIIFTLFLVLLKITPVFLENEIVSFKIIILPISNYNNDAIFWFRM